MESVIQVGNYMTTTYLVLMVQPFPPSNNVVLENWAYSIVNAFHLTYITCNIQLKELSFIYTFFLVLTEWNGISLIYR